MVINILIHILISIFFLGFIIFIHELFHFLAAKALRIRTYDFSIGFGKKIICIQNKKMVSPKKVDPDTMKYCLRLFPVGGFVSFGQSTLSDDGLFSYAPWKRIIVAAAGPIGNFVFAAVLMSLLLWSLPVQTMIQSVTPHSIAASMGIRAGDQITAVDSAPPINASFTAARNKGGTVCLQVIPKHGTHTQTLCASLPKHHLIGITYTGGDPTTLYNVIPRSIQETTSLTRYYINEVGGMLHHVNFSDLTGPVGVVNTMQASANSYTNFLFILIVVNIALGFSNLFFPSTITDGGRIFLDLIAIVLRKQKISSHYLDVISVTLVITLFIFATFSDVIHLFTPHIS